MIQQKLTKTKTAMILITKTLVIFHVRSWLKVNHDSLVDMGMWTHWTVLQLLYRTWFRTCRTSSFWPVSLTSQCTVAWQLAKFQLTRRIARSLGDSWASCLILKSRDDDDDDRHRESAQRPGISGAARKLPFIVCIMAMQRITSHGGALRGRQRTYWSVRLPGCFGWTRHTTASLSDTSTFTPSSSSSSVISVESNQNVESKTEKRGVQRSTFTSRNQKNH